jgi:ABC-type branched-subunit amino acid transport system substrate-binding protein
LAPRSGWPGARISDKEVMRERREGSQETKRLVKVLKLRIFYPKEDQMKKFLVLLSIFLLCGVLGSGNALAADPDKIKVGILLPLTGTFAAVAETQRDGALLAVDVINKKGGLNMPWGKVKVEGVVADDEAKLDVGVRRYRYMVTEGMKGVGGQTWAPLAFAINALVQKDPMPYFPVCVMAKEGFLKGKLADSTFATA